MADIVQENDLFKSIFESAVEGILVVDPNGILLSANPAAELIFDYEPGELINQKLEILIPENLIENHLSQRDNSTKNQIPRPKELNLDLFGLKKNGSKFPVKVSLRPTIIEGKQITNVFVSDASELKTFEQELKSKDAKDRALLEAIPDMIVIQNYAGDIIDIHKPEQIYVPEHIGFQLPKEELIGKNISELVPPEMSKKILKAHDEAIKTNEIQIREYSLEGTNGIIYFEARTARLNNHNLLTIIRDITERKRVIQELKESEAKTSAIINALPDTIIIHDTEGNFLEIQESELISSLFDREKVIGKNLKDIYPIELSTKIINVLKKAHETQSLQVIEAPMPGKDRIVYCEGRVIPFEDNKLIAVIRDITQTKAVRDVLYVRNRALEAAGNGIVIADATLPDNPIMYVNDAFSQITGYGISEVLGKNCRFLQNGDRDQKAIQIIRTALKEGQPCNVELRNYRKDGALFWNELTITPLYNDQGSLTHFIGVQSDVTERKKAEILKDRIQKTLEMIAQHWPLDFIGDTIVETVEQHIEDCLASILFLDQEKQTLHNLSAPNVPN
ncbi:MAG: PAS domain S-box protein, partial [Maribacter sp.]|nr:PAS domain S-box protein [Maribacter sp.]